MTPTTATTCPSCGKELQPVALGTHTTPWLCAGCQRGFWASELSAEARAAYRPHHGDWGLGAARLALISQVDQELAEAHVRGTSLREDQFVLTLPSVLTNLSTNTNLDPAFKASLITHLANLGGRP